MLDLTRKEQDEVWSSADQADLQRTTDLARRALGASTAMLRSPAAEGNDIRHLSGDPSPVEAAAGAEPTAGSPVSVAARSLRLDAPLLVAGWPTLGVLSVVATEPRDWTETDRATLCDLANSLAELLVARCRAAERRSEDADPAPLLTLPGPVGLHRSLESIVELTERLRTEAQPEMVAAHAQAIRTIAQSLQAICVAADGSSPVQREPAMAAGPTTQHHADEAGAAEPALDDVLSARILLADDLDLNRKLISDMLSIEGHVVDSVPDGAAAVKAAGEQDYDLILMDMIMPGMDGVTAARAIRAMPAPAGDVPIVALTAHSMSEQLENCLQAGMNALLTKPMSLDALTEAVATWTRSSRKAA